MFLNATATCEYCDVVEPARVPLPPVREGSVTMFALGCTLPKGWDYFDEMSPTGVDGFSTRGVKMACPACVAKKKLPKLTAVK